MRAAKSTKCFEGGPSQQKGCPKFSCLSDKPASLSLLRSIESGWNSMRERERISWMHSRRKKGHGNNVVVVSIGGGPFLPPSLLSSPRGKEEEGEENQSSHPFSLYEKEKSKDRETEKEKFIRPLPPSSFCYRITPENLASYPNGGNLGPRRRSPTFPPSPRDVLSSSSSLMGLLSKLMSPQSFFSKTRIHTHTHTHTHTRTHIYCYVRGHLTKGQIEGSIHDVALKHPERKSLSPQFCSFCSFPSFPRQIPSSSFRHPKASMRRQLRRRRRRRQRQ